MCSVTKILYTVATNKSGELVTAVDADKGSDFFCPVCNNELLLRKSGNTGKNAKRPHFAHKTLTPNCTPESALHHSFKRLLTRKLEQHISDSTPLEITWKCNNCGEKHSGNLIKKAINVKLEYYMGECQPDIALIDKGGKVFAVIEIVVTHKPEQKILEFYRANNITLIQINLESDQDIFNLNLKASNPNIVSLCTNPKCPSCGRATLKRYLTIIDGWCYKCKGSMNIATIHRGFNGYYMRPDEFSPSEVAIANSKGANLKMNYSKTMRERYMSDTCPNCNAFAGSHFVFTEYYSPAGYGEIPSVVHDIGFVCPSCEPDQFGKRGFIEE